MTNNKNNLIGLSVARWKNETSGTLTDSNTYISDDGTIVADGGIIGSGLAIITQSGAQLQLDASIDQVNTYAITFPATNGDTANQYLKSTSITSGGKIVNLDWAPGDGSGTVTSVGATTSSTGLTISGSPITTSGSLTINLNNNLQTLAGLNSTGLVTQTSVGTFVERMIVAGSNIVVTNGNGVDGSPTVALNVNLSGLNSIGTGSLTATGTITGGTVTTSGTITAGTISSSGDITSASDISGQRLNLSANNHSLTIEGNITQSGDIVLIFPANEGNENQVIATDGFGNLSWKTTNIYTNAGSAATVGINTLNGTAGVTINTTAVTTSSIINVTRNAGVGTPPSVITIGNLIVGSIINNSSFTVYSTVNGDVGNINWSIINP